MASLGAPGRSEADWAEVGSRETLAAMERELDLAAVGPLEPAEQAAVATAGLPVEVRASAQILELVVVAMMELDLVQVVSAVLPVLV